MTSTPSVQTDQEIAGKNQELEKKIRRILDDYNSKGPGEKKFRVLSPEMAIPPKMLK